jgi:tRNA threonylcarbamoyladenosine biosynthesis protein TsaB
MILLINTAQQTSSVAISEKGEVVCSEENPVMNESAGWLHPAVDRLLHQAGLSIRGLEAIAVISGPGSYTGLRVGMAAAKGFCYAMNVPLITLSSLELMAATMVPMAREKKALICPMIDARRNEVYTAMYDSEGRELLVARALILDKNSFEQELSRDRIIFFGSGAQKWEKMYQADRAVSIAQPDDKQSFAELAQQKFDRKDWSDPIYSEPLYLKEFFSY